jgi:hypothetical protein
MIAEPLGCSCCGVSGAAANVDTEIDNSGKQHRCRKNAQLAVGGSNPATTAGMAVTSIRRASPLNKAYLKAGIEKPRDQVVSRMPTTL